MALKATVIQPGPPPRHAECHAGSPSRLNSGVLAVFFLLASLVAIYEVTKIPRASSDATQTTQTIRTIREFYAALNEFMETGNASAVSQIVAPGALAFAPEQGIFGADSGLLTYLLALRTTLPQLRFIVDHIDAGDDLAIAKVRVSGIADAAANVWPRAHGTSHEFFRVRDSRIVEHWTTTPGPMLLLPLTSPTMLVEVIQPGHLAIGELSFPPGRLDAQTIDGHALVIVQRGSLTLIGNGSGQILDIKNGAITVPGQDDHVSVGPGQAISVPEYKALVRNSESGIADALVATLVDDPRQVLGTPPGERQPPPPALNDAALIGAQGATTYGDVTVRPFVFDDRSIPAGSWELEIAFAVLGPGASLPIPADGEWAVAHVISNPVSPSPPVQQSADHLSLLTNHSDQPVVALVMRLRTTP
jgi:hypothetical protein